MNATTLDLITATFVNALQAGQGTLQQYALPLLAVFALIAFCTQLWPLVMSGAGLGDSVGTILLTIIKIGVFYWLLVNLAPIATAAFLTFLTWGLAPTGGGFTAASFLKPSAVLDIGFQAAFPIQSYLLKMTGTAQLLNFFSFVLHSIAYDIIVIAFALVALHLMVTIIEFHFAVLIGTVLIPWGILQPTAFFTEFAIGWITGGLVRVLVTVGTISIAIPLFQLLAFQLTPGGDPTIYSALVMAITAGIFAILSRTIPGRAAAIVGRGAALGLHGGTIIAAGLTGFRGGLGVIRGVSTLVTGGR